MSTTQTSSDRSLSGIWFMVGTAFFWSVMSLFVKVVGQRLPSQEIVLVRAAVTLGYSYALIRWAGIPSVWGTNKPLLWLRGLFGFAALSCFYLAVTKLPLADATVLHYTNPVWTALLAAPLLGESLDRTEIGGTLLSLIGVVLIAQPSFLFGQTGAELPLLYVGVGLFGAVCAATAFVIVRKLRATEPPLVIVFYFPLVSVLGGVPTAATTNLQWPTLWEWLMLVGGVAGCAQIAQVFLTNGLHRERAGRAMSVSYLQILFATGWGLLLFNELPNLWSISGALLVTGGTFIAARDA